MHARHPEIAERWEKHTPKGAKLPEQAGKMTAKAVDIDAVIGKLGLDCEGVLLDDVYHGVSYEQNEQPSEPLERLVKMVVGHLRERPAYYRELEESLALSSLKMRVRPRKLSDLAKGAGMGTRFGSPIPPSTSYGSAPRAETPPIPDFQDLYYQPETDERKKREAEAGANRRRATASRNRAVYGFHGTTQLGLDPELRYERPDDEAEAMHGEKIGQREPLFVPARKLLDKDNDKHEVEAESRIATYDDLRRETEQSTLISEDDEDDEEDDDEDEDDDGAR